MANKEWRPQNPYHKQASYPYDYFYNEQPEFSIFEAGASAMHKADVEYLDGQCTEHQPITLNVGYYVNCYDPQAEVVKRKDCPICYAVWKEGIK